MLRESKYPADKIQFLIDGFTCGFDIGYTGPEHRKETSPNIPLHIGSKTELQNKIMKEVKLGRYAGPFEKISFDNYMQSPVGLVPKAGNKTRLIFHLSYEFASGKGLLNANTPKEKCSVQYWDLDYAVQSCLNILKFWEGKGVANQPLVFTKSDLASAFRILPLKVNFKWLILKAVDPQTGKTYYFVDKCLPFGVSISYELFQAFSDALRHITQYAINNNSLDVITNYLDDFLFIALTLVECNGYVLIFLKICNDIGCPVSLEKTEWGASLIIFLGILLDGIHKCLCIPQDKRLKVLNMLKWFVDSRKATIKQIQVLTGSLNFLTHAIVPGRVFTRGMYTKLCHTDSRGRALKDHHHVKIDKEFEEDCKVWTMFLEQDARGSNLC